MMEVDVQVIRVEPGDEEPEGADYVKVDRLAGDRFQFAGTVAVPGGAVFATGTTDIQGPYPDQETAEAVAIDWAQGRGAETLYLIPPDAVG